MSRVKLVIFDWAGTTIDFGSMAPVAAFMEVFARRGLTVTTVEARGPMGTHKKDHIRFMLQMPRIAALWRTTTGREWAEDDVEDLYRAVAPLQVELAAWHADLAPGLHDCVRALRAQGVKIAASTGYFRQAAEAVAAAAKAEGYEPDYLICADDVRAGRPAPWMVFRCMEALDIYPPSAVVKVGDTLIDVAEGRNAGVRSIAVVDSSSEMGLSRADFDALNPAERAERRQRVRRTFQHAGADAVIDTLGDLPALLLR